MGNPLVVVDQLCQAYHWTFEQATAMTLPQIILLNHAASVNAERSRIRTDAKTANNKHKQDVDPVVFNGKRLSELSTEELSAYYSNWG